jgi:hypothetical protein
MSPKDKSEWLLAWSKYFASTNQAEAEAAFDQAYAIGKEAGIEQEADLQGNRYSPRARAVIPLA